MYRTFSGKKYSLTLILVEIDSDPYRQALDLDSYPVLPNYVDQRGSRSTTLNFLKLLQMRKFKFSPSLKARACSLPTSSSALSVPDWSNCETTVLVLSPDGTYVVSAELGPEPSQRRHV
jgi:hypothetical protein